MAMQVPLLKTRTVYIWWNQKYCSKNYEANWNVDFGNVGQVYETKTRKWNLTQIIYWNVRLPWHLCVWPVIRAKTYGMLHSIGQEIINVWSLLTQFSFITKDYLIIEWKQLHIQWFSIINSAYICASLKVNYWYNNPDKYINEVVYENYSLFKSMDIIMQ